MGIIIAIVLSRFVIYPINKLIESAEKITEEDKKTIRNKKSNKKGNLESVFGLKTGEFTYNLTNEEYERLIHGETEKSEMEDF